MAKKIVWQDENRTAAFAEDFAPALKTGDVLCLEGDLGIGKTTFTRYLARALGVGAAVKSPTYTIVREYEGENFPIYHIDAYRLEETGAEDVGLADYLDSDGLCVIEWPQFIQDELPLNYLWLKLTRQGDGERQLTVEGVGPRGQQLERLLEASSWAE